MAKSKSVKNESGPSAKAPLTTKTNLAKPSVPLTAKLKVRAAGKPAPKLRVKAEAKMAGTAALAAAGKVAETPGDEWWAKGVRFECQGSGRCCVSRGEYGFVYMTLKDRQRMAKVMKLPLAKFTKEYCAKTDGVYHLIDGKGPECLFLKEAKCSIYEGRPDQCRSWPFWPEVMPAKRWKKEVAAYCPGIVKGRLYKAEEIREIIDLQSKSEYDLVTGN